jgi:KipI family sensor histidine kinase inhibitor
MKILPCGEHALLIELADERSALATHRTLRDAKLSGILEIVPAERTVLVTVVPGSTQLAELAQRLSTLSPRGVSATERGVIELEVVYDGPDLDFACEFTGMDSDELVDWHCSQLWSVAFCGFAPGFGYLTSDEWTQSIPRRPESRLKVRPGAVGLAGRYCGVYPAESPGGWQIIGHTSARMWDLGRQCPALLVPGTRVAFVPA